MPISAAPPPVKKTPAAKPQAEPQITRDRRETLTGYGQLAQVPLIAFKQYADAGAISMYFPGIAREIAKLAETREEIAALVDPLIKVGPYFGLVTAILPLVLQVGVNHKRFTAGAMGTVPAVTLSSQIEGNLARQELEALTVQLQAERDAAAVREEIAESRRQMVNQVASRETVIG